MLILAIGLCFCIAVQWTTPKSKIRNELIRENSIGMSFVEVPPGTFGMGYSQITEQLRMLKGFSDQLFWQAGMHYETTEVGHSFWLSRFEVTQKQFAKFVEETGYLTDNERLEIDGNWRETNYPISEDTPVTQVSLNDATAFCKWLSEKEGKLYRLPTETEWEYACRAGSSALFSFGDDAALMPKHGNIADQSLEKTPAITQPTRKYSKGDDGFCYLAPVGSFLPNKFGLYDMHGNSAEICSDFFRTRDSGGLGKPYPELCVVRGGGWCCPEAFSTTFYRLEVSRNLGSLITGFRVIQEERLSDDHTKDKVNQSPIESLPSKNKP